MELLYKMLMVLAIVHGARDYCEKFSDFKKLVGNKIRKDSISVDNKHYIECGSYSNEMMYKVRSYTPDDALRPANFYKYPFTSVAMNTWFIDVRDSTATFSFAELNNKGFVSSATITTFALQIDTTGKTGELAYWLPQGGLLDIPQKPTRDEPAQYVFTPDFTGCTWTVTPTQSGRLLIRHVQSGKEDKFNELSDHEKGDDTYAMLFEHYGYIQKDRRHVRSGKGFAYMRYDNHSFGGRWYLHVQRHACSPGLVVPLAKTRKYKDSFKSSGEINQLEMSYFKESKYPIINGRSTYGIPI